MIGVGSTTSVSVDPLIGETLEGRYRLTERAGFGRSGTLYRAEQTSVPGRTVAVKILNTVASASEAVKALQHDAKLISRLRHPSTVKLIDLGFTKSSQLYLVTEFLEGEPLSSVLERAPLGELETLGLLREVCDVLDEAHALGVLHGDLNPTNLFIERVGKQSVLRVIDFGLSRLLGTPDQPFRSLPEFAAPETLRGAGVSVATDIYQLGVVAYCCLSGHPPFTASSSGDGTRRQQSERPPRLADQPSLRGPLQPRLEQLIASMLEKDAAKRPKRISEVRAEISQLEPQSEATHQKLGIVELSTERELPALGGLTTLEAIRALGAVAGTTDRPIGGQSVTLATEATRSFSDLSEEPTGSEVVRPRELTEHDGAQATAPAAQGDAEVSDFAESPTLRGTERDARVPPSFAEVEETEPGDERRPAQPPAIAPARPEPPPPAPQLAFSAAAIVEKRNPFLHDAASATPALVPPAPELPRPVPRTVDPLITPGTRSRVVWATAVVLAMLAMTLGAAAILVFWK
ncbi:MAG: serine/threonine protein kinase [Deltaproteobacteria bacterium]|nr:serine/threonine protein kinase [Deltaproteobacteria bacterium]